MDEFNFYKDNYKFEFEVKEKLDKSAATSITILIILGSIISLFLNKACNIELSCFSLLFLLPLLLSIMFYLLSLYFILKALYNYVYMYMPTSSQLNKYHHDLKLHYEISGNVENKAQKEWEEYIIEEYAFDAHINFENNGRKSGFIHLSNTFIISTIILLIIAAVPYYISNIKKENFQKVEIINFNKMENLMGKEVPKPATTTPNPKPTPPPSIGRREGTIPKPTPPPTKQR